MKSWRELLMLYLAGELSADDLAAFQRYLEEDAACRAELDDWQNLATAVREESDSRVESLPALPTAFYQRLHDPHPNGVHKTIYHEDKMTTLVQPLRKSKRAVPQSVTLVAAVFAVIAFAGALLFMRNPNSPSNDPLAGIQAQMETATPLPTLTFTPTPNLTQQVNEAAVTATQLIGEATSSAATAFAVMTATPIPVQAEFIPSLVPTVVAPQGWNGQTPLAAPIVSAPALLLQNIDLQGGYGAIIGLDISPDGSRLVISRAAPGVFSLWLIDLATGEESPILVYDVELIAPKFNADGTQVIVGTNSTGIFVLDVSEF